MVALTVSRKPDVIAGGIPPLAQSYFCLFLDRVGDVLSRVADFSSHAADFEDGADGGAKVVIHTDETGVHR
jgi:hypothetical protein